MGALSVNFVQAVQGTWDPTLLSLARCVNGGFWEQDRPIEKEIVHRYIEHIPVEKKYLVETKFAGEVEKSSGRKVRLLLSDD